MTPEKIIAQTFSAAFCDTLAGDGFAREVVAALSAAGFVIAPKEPTASMCEAGFDAALDTTTGPEECKVAWRAMVAAIALPSNG